MHPNNESVRLIFNLVNLTIFKLLYFGIIEEVVQDVRKGGSRFFYYTTQTFSFGPKHRYKQIQRCIEYEQRK
jgi:predicted transcriptional regulator